MSKSVRIMIGIGLLIGIAALGVSLFPSPSNQGYNPEQPIPFSHKLHAGTHQMQCKYCHADVERSKHASVPAVAVCMNCHLVVKTDSPWIQKIQTAYNEQKPIEWIRVHELPDFVNFPHKRHVAAGLNCKECHGPIDQMDKVYQHAPLTMGWCMECHRGRSTPSDVKASQLLKDAASKDPQGLVAPIQCSTCHQ